MNVPSEQCNLHNTFSLSELYISDKPDNKSFMLHKYIHLKAHQQQKFAFCAYDYCTIPLVLSGLCQNYSDSLQNVHNSARTFFLLIGNQKGASVRVPYIVICKQKCARLRWITCQIYVNWISIRQ